MTTIGIRVSEYEKRALSEIARKNDLTISYIIRKMIRELLKENNK